MANRQKSSTLVEQAISKLLDSRSMPAPNDSALLQLPHAGAKIAVQTPWQRSIRQIENSSSEKRANKATAGKVLVVIAWILLVLNVLAVTGNLIYEGQRQTGLEAIEKTISRPIQITMLVAGVCVLSLTSWLYWKNRYGGTAKMPAIIVVILLVLLAFLTRAPGGEITGREQYVKMLSQHFLTMVTPKHKLVTGILYNEDKPSALVDTQIVHEGDIINGAKVVKIHRDKVEFEKNGGRWSQAVQEAPQSYRR